jgi:hypothetical protein
MHREPDPLPMVVAEILCDYASIVVAVLRNMIKMTPLKVLKCI